MSVSTVPAGSFANASLVGAKTVNGPFPDSVSTRPAAFTAATSVVWSFEFIAFSTMVLLGYIAAPPTITVFSANAGEAIIGAPASPIATAVSTASFVNLMTSSIFDSASLTGSQGQIRSAQMFG